MKILITGANGMLAKSVINKFSKENELVCTDVNELDITDENRVMEYVEKIKPEYIINCAAYTAVDKAEDNEELADKINGDGPANLAKAAKKVGSKLVHISTDYVFNGDLDITKTYKEDDKVDPVTAYGRTKQHGEEGVKNGTDQYYIFRTAWLYGDGNNFIRTMSKLGEKNKEVKVVSDQYGSPTYTEDLTNIIYQAIENKIPYGTYHSTNEGFTTWYEFTKKIYELLGMECKVIPVSSEEFASKAKRPKNSQLSKEKLKKEGIKIPTYEDALKRYLEFEKNRKENEKNEKK